MDIFLKPNWRTNVRENFEYLTTIFASDNGSEQRSAERINARRNVEFDALLWADALRDLRAKLHSRSDFTCYVPEPVHEVSTVAVYAPLGSTTVTFADPIPVTYVGRRVCVYGQGRHFFANVTGVAGSTAVFLEPIATEARVGDSLRLCMVGRLPGNVAVDYINDDVATFKLMFDQLPGQRNTEYSTAFYPVFQGREVLTEKPNWSRPPSVEIITDYEVTDFRRGMVATYSPIDYMTKITEFTFTGRSQNKMHRLIDFYHRQMGRLNEFWCPSWTSDMRLVQNVNTSSGTIVVAGRAAADHYANSTVETAIAVRLNGGAWRYRTILNITTDGTSSTITLNDSLGVAITAGSEIGIHWLNVCRFASDTMTVQWITDDVAQTVFQIQSLETLPVDGTWLHI